MKTYEDSWQLTKTHKKKSYQLIKIIKNRCELLGQLNGWKRLESKEIEEIN